MMTPGEIRQMLLDEDEQLKRLHEIVSKTIEEEGLIVDNLLHPAKETLTTGQRLSDKVARFGGSWAFILSFLGLLVLWIVVNAFVLANRAYDPYPFILLNLILSCVAALQAPIIMMSQNRQEEKDRQRSENDYMVNLKAELQIRSLHQKIDLLFEKQLKALINSQAEQLTILEELQSRFSKHTDLNHKNKE
ncbi:MAG: DUF1003 domain-containing protein [Candidatus Kapaibacterium sp.]|jgi:uncharacterized membrane protein